ncbi:acyl-CoA carboxylase subunit beta [Actinocrinis sp.]|uniref:acyl-CoA carboxylase subunit beta n=1 Tax=Actinocrinis sp. TaxID=1920516 RepID=UPI0032C23324
MPRPDAATASARRRPSLRENVEKWRSVRDELVRGDDKASERQHSKRKLTARERIALLLDEGSFTEFDIYRRTRAGGSDAREPRGDSVITGSGTVDGRTVFVYAQDFRVFGGSLGRVHAEKIHKVMDLAIATGSPLVSLKDSGGARIQEGVAALAGYGGVFQRNVRASGVIPQISVILGPCAGGAAYSPALTDFVFMVRETSYMYLTGPDVVKEVTGEEVTHEMLGGADMHATTSGVAGFVYDDEETCLAEVRYLLSLLPSNNRETPPRYATEEQQSDDPCTDLLDLVPTEPNKPYDIRDVISRIVDTGDFLEVHESWASNVVCALARVDGHTVGIVGNQPMVKAGVLDIHASEKAARFVRTCDAFNIPLISLVDVPGFLPGVEQEYGGIIRHGAKLLYAYCEATVPRISVVLRKAYGGAYIVMDSRSIGADVSLAWPGNEIAVMGAQGAVSVIHHRQLAASDDPPALRARLAEEYADEMMHPYFAAERGLVDDVIDPCDTRHVIIKALEMLRGKQAEVVARKHGNQPT